MATVKKSEVPGYLSVSKVLVYAMHAFVVFGIIMLGFRVFLLAFSAQPGSAFVDFVARTSSQFLQPFRGIFPPAPVGDTGYLDVAAIFAMIVYGLIAWGFSALIVYVQSKIDKYNQ